MASSPTSSCSSSFSSPFTASSPGFSELPVMALRDKIIGKIMENRVTLIVGETGCGKSSQIPQFLLEENMEPILCTQPRRFAVVAVAQMVASARNCEVGGEVGYHIGHSKVFSARSKIIFKTAGVLLDEMRDKGLNALNYKVIVLDEVHERSVESDLVLVCVKQFLLKNKDLRVVLMSATANISRYREYFRDIGRGERVEVLAIPSTTKNTIFQKKVSYLEQVTKLLGMDCENLSSRFCSGSSPMTAKADFKPEVHKLIHDLVLHIHKNEPDIEKSILVFLPTYYTLEQQWSLLKPFSQSFKVHILHRSIDTDQALKAMKIWKSHRKVILATNIAESSVTIPKVGYVIDSCRSLQVFWDGNRKTDAVELVWVSKSQAEQRKGRTGRTCDGHVYRLLPGSFFGKLEDYESPAILKLSLRQQVLLICCTDSKAINDPKALLQKAMDPPDPDDVEDALDLLVQMRALEKTSSRGRHESTFYGHLLASFSLSFDASVLILKFADIGLIREGILFGILMDLQPLPILRPFGRDNQFMEYTDSYYSEHGKNIGLGKKEVLYMANFCAFQFWERSFKDKCRLERLKNTFKLNETKDAEILLPKIEEEWCSFHNLVLTALQQVNLTYNEIIHSLHRFRPKFLAMSYNLPVYYDPVEFQHTCHLTCVQDKDADPLLLEDENLEHNESRKCITIPFVGPHDFQTDVVPRKFASIVKEMRIQLTGDASREENRYPQDDGLHVAGAAPLCRYFVNGSCNKGNQCMFSHSLQAKRPICKFFFSLQGCRSGDSCFFSHDSGPLTPIHNESSLCCPEEEEQTDPEYLLQFVPASLSDGYTLLLDDTDFHFSTHLARRCFPYCIISTTPQADLPNIDPSLEGVNILNGLSTPYQTILSTKGDDLIPWRGVSSVLWFARFGQECGEAQKRLVQDFFSHLAIRILGSTLAGVQVILVMNSIRFSQLQVEKLASESFFLLRESFPFNESIFGKFEEVSTKRPMVVSKPIAYVFDLCPTSELKWDDFGTLLQQLLSRN